jgi:polyhydroxybutyrate depolymerase
MEFLEAGGGQGALNPHRFDLAAVSNGTFVFHILIWLCVSAAFVACRDGGTPPQPAQYDYEKAIVTSRCEPGSRAGHVGVSDAETLEGAIRYHVRTPSNYDATFAHPLLMVFSPAGQSGLMSERMTGLTSQATRAGLVVVYVDHRPIGLPSIEQLATIPKAVARKWCIDEKRVSVTGHSDGGTVTMALAVLDRTKQVPTAIAPSAAGWTGKDLEAYQCPAPLPVMIMHNKHDSLFPGWGVQTAAWWAACNRCEPEKTKLLEGGCLAYQDCASGGPTLYCEGPGTHRDWPNFNRMMMEFLLHPDTFL